MVKEEKPREAPLNDTPIPKADTPTQERKQLELMSGSFGRNDVFTLAWVAEISKAVCRRR